MKVNLPYIKGDPELNNTIQKISNAFSSISKDNTNNLTITGKCGTIIDGIYYSATVVFNRSQVPSFVFVQEGDAFIPKNGAGPNEVLVKSRNASEEFTLVLIF